LGNLLNVGAGVDLPVAELAELVARIVDYNGEIRFDPKRPDGTPRKLLDVSRIHSLGWRPRISLEDGIASTYEWYCANAAQSVAG
jgi:nucleoside-diphosphate-sugar epimerase